MCLITNQEKYITTEDKIVFKLLTQHEDSFVSPYYQYEYTIGDIKEVVIGKRKTDSIYYIPAFDGYDSDEALTRTLETGNSKADYYEEGIHFFYPERMKMMYTKYSPFKVERRDVIGKFVIPSGSEVIDGFTHLGITNRVKFIEVVSWEQAVEYSREDDSLPSDSLSHISEPE